MPRNADLIRTRLSTLAGAYSTTKPSDTIARKNARTIAAELAQLRFGTRHWHVFF
jgi:hypothetical protein